MLVVEAREGGRLLRVDVDVWERERRMSAAMACDRPCVYTPNKAMATARLRAPNLPHLASTVQRGLGGVSARVRVYAVLCSVRRVAAGVRECLFGGGRVHGV
jgi:hypothetical protein